MLTHRFRDVLCGDLPISKQKPRHNSTGALLMSAGFSVGGGATLFHLNNYYRHDWFRLTSVAFWLPENVGLTPWLHRLKRSPRTAKPFSELIQCKAHRDFRKPTHRPQHAAARGEALNVRIALGRELLDGGVQGCPSEGNCSAVTGPQVLAARAAEPLEKEKLGRAAELSYFRSPVNVVARKSLTRNYLTVARVGHVQVIFDEIIVTWPRSDYSVTCHKPDR